MNYTITELLGDGIAAELAAAVRTLASRLPVRLEFESIDLSLPNRLVRGPAIYDEAAEAMHRNCFTLKYPTITADESPNAILRQRCGFSVIHRPVATIPGVPTNFRRELNLHIIRVATGGTYDDPGRMIGTDAAVSLRIVERGPCREAAHYAFLLARKLGATVTSSSKHTIQKVTDGLFESVVDEVAAGFADVVHQEELFDALLAKIVMVPERFHVILVLNEYGDFLSDMACGLAGSMGIGASASLSFNARGEVQLAMFDPAGGTAPDIAGKNLANPTAIFLALSMLLAELGQPALGSLIDVSTRAVLQRGLRTRDLGGHLSTTAFTHAVADELSTRLA
ncbi:MAG: isocitrate/isopropylmalate family dehydrogenase [Pirellulales bacterium]